MGSLTRLSGGLAAVTLAGAVMMPAIPAADAQPVPQAASVAIPCSTAALVTAINAANLAGTTRIVLARYCAYRITQPASGIDGLPVITADITLSGGTGTQITRAASAPAFRILEVSGAGSLTINSVSISNGNPASDGGGILNNGRLAVSHSVISGNTGGNGGAVSNEDGATATISDSRLSQNVTASSGGGAIVNFGTLTLIRDVLSDNTAPLDGGALNLQPGSTATVNQTTITRNTAGDTGGGVFNFGDVTFNGSQVRNNNAASDAGGIGTANNDVTLTSTIVRANSPDNCDPPIPGCAN
jgi:hypothetical protein